MLMWSVCLVLAIVIFIVCNALGIWRYVKSHKKRRAFSMVTLFLGVTFVSIFVMMLPFCREAFAGTGAAGFKMVLNAVRASLQAFSLDGEYLDFYAGAQMLGGGLAMGYQIFAVILYVLAPILLIGVVVSFFQNVLDAARLKTSGGKTVYVFSELNPQSLSLAKSCLDHDRRRNKKSLAVFTDVYEQSTEESAEIVAGARAIRAICFKNDILDLGVDFGKKKGEVRFFIMGSDDTENIRHAVTLMERYGGREDTFLHVLSDSEEGELIIGSAMDEEMKMDVRRINSEQLLVYSYLYDTEKNRLFDMTRTAADGKKILPIVLVGLGKYGTELLRALVWYGQLPGVRVQIHVFEKDPLAEKKFASLCPELMEMNHADMEGESKYDIWFHRISDTLGMDAKTIDFDRGILSLKEVSAAFVTLGEDAKNVRIAAKLRRLFTRSLPEDESPMIRTVVFDPKKCDIVAHHPLTDFKGHAYDIGFFGDTDTVWSYDVIIQDGLDADAKARHLKWVDKTPDAQRQGTVDFYKYEFYRKSSMSSAIRSKVRRELHVPGTDKAPEERTLEEKMAIQRIEHAGWNAYMRSEGYRFAAERNDLARCHHLLIPFDDLPEKEKTKDDD